MPCPVIGWGLSTSVMASAPTLHRCSLGVSQLHSSQMNVTLFLCSFWLCWVFIAARGLSLAVAGGGYSSLQCVGFSLRWLHLLQSTGSVVVAHGLWSAVSVVVAHGISCSAACGIFPDQGSNPCPLHWQADSQPLHHQGSPGTLFLEGRSERCTSMATSHH